MAEHAGGQAGGGHRAGDGRGHERACARMGGVALDHDRASGGERRGGIAPGGREGQREVRRAEYRDRADRDHAQPQVRAGQRLAIGQGGIDAQLLPRALAHDIGEQAQLAHGAAPFAFQTGAGQSGFLHGGFDQLVADGQDFRRDGFQKRGALLAPGGAVGIEGGGGGGAGGIDFGRAIDGEGRAGRLTRGGGHGAEFGHGNLLIYSDILPEVPERNRWRVP